MARRQALDTPNDRGQSEIVSIPAPVQGLNERESRTSIGPTEARQLVNWDVDGNVLKVRDGYAEHAATSAETSAVKTLFAHEMTTSTQLIAVNGGKLYNITSAGDTAHTHDGSWTNDEWITVNSNNFTVAVNGTDVPFRWNGTAVSATGLSGASLALSALTYVEKVGTRIWFAENNELDVWYTGAGSVSGLLTKFQLSQVAKNGHTMAIGQWSEDMGDGPDDYTVFVTSTGEVLVYSGDPGGTFSLVGKYQASPPVSRRCLFNIGGELVLVSYLGAFTINAIMQGLPRELSQADIWGKVAPGIAKNANSFGAQSPWFGFYANGKAYISFPINPGSDHRQYVLNARLNAWTQYDWTAYSMAYTSDDTLYFGGPAGKVHKITGANDDGADIIARAKPGFSYPGGGGAYKRAVAARANVVADDLVEGRILVETDFSETEFSGPNYDIVAESDNADWDDAVWDEASWGEEGLVNPQWKTVNGRGRALAFGLEVTTQAENVVWDTVDALMKVGGHR